MSGGSRGGYGRPTCGQGCALMWPRSANRLHTTPDLQPHPPSTVPAPALLTWQVHYGRASLTKLSRLPAFFVFPQQQLNVQAAAACLAASSLLAAGGGASDSSGSSGGGGPVLVFVDQPLLHRLDQLKAALLELLEQQQGPGATAQLVFPTVPQQHMEPEGQQGVQQAQPTQAGCCGGGACGSQQQQQEAAPQQTGCGSAACCSAAPSSSGGAGAGAPQVGPSPAAGSPVSRDDVPSSSSGGQHSLAGYQWRLPAGVAPQDCGLVWVGAPDAPALLQLQLTYNTCRWAMLDPSLLPLAAVASPADGAASPGSGGGGSSAALREGLPLEISRALRRRYFLVEKAREASIVGILVGTLGAAGYADAVQRLRAAAAAAGKKTYTLLMGKPSPAKLANFPEIEVGAEVGGGGVVVVPL